MIEEHSSIYQIYLRNFTEEGTFKAAIPHLAAVAALGFDWVYCTPFHPIGIDHRKGRMGSPYAIADYRSIDPELGTIDDFREFLKAAHGLGLRVMMDIVFNHTSRDAVLAREHPEWFMLEGLGSAVSRGELEMPTSGTVLGRKCEEWTDVVDFDYSSSPALWMELISVLSLWRDEGIDGFRCDMASLVPLDFWKQARQRINQYDPGSRKERHPLVWLAESVHPAFVKRMRSKGFGVWSDPELHSVFDLTYDYDGWEKLEAVLGGMKPAEQYLEYLYTQETLYPARSRKIRFLENHDQQRGAFRFPSRRSLESWTLLMSFIPGVFFAYMGQEWALKDRPSLFERDPIKRKEAEEGDTDIEFSSFFGKALEISKKAKIEAPRFSWFQPCAGIVILERCTDDQLRYVSIVDTRVDSSESHMGCADIGSWLATVAGRLPAPGIGTLSKGEQSVSCRNIFSGEFFELKNSLELAVLPLLLEFGRCVGPKGVV